MTMEEVDGSILEGGGQIIRMAVAFSALLSKPIRLVRIRAGRPKPGLQAQHMTGIQLTSELARARIEGCKLLSTTVEFVPGVMATSSTTAFKADTRTAGATTLLAQISLPCALLVQPCPVQLDLHGGTNAAFAPQFEYYSSVFIPTLAKFGADVKCDVIRKGYFPKGGGHIRLQVKPVHQLKPVTLTEFGNVTTVDIMSSVAGSLPVKLAQQAAQTAKQRLSEFFNSINQKNVRIQIDAYKEEDRGAAFGNGNTISIVATTSTGCLLGSGSIGARGKSASELGSEAADELIESLKLRVCVDMHLQDQLILYMALASGVSRIRSGPLTLHTKTAIHIAEQLTGVHFTVSEVPCNTDNNCERDVCLIECEGIQFKNKALG